MRQRETCGALLRALLTVALSFAARTAFAVGTDGAEANNRRYVLALGTGWDHVGGYGEDGYGFVEVGAKAEARVWNWVYVGGTVGLRQDLADYSYALGESRSARAQTVVAQLMFGYDSAGLHISAGPWIYGSARDRKKFHLGFLPFGTLALRAGRVDKWHFKLHVADGAPFTAEGAAWGARILVGFPSGERHHIAAGVYSSLGEKTIGLATQDEIALGSRFLGSQRLRVGINLGTDFGAWGRPEILLFSGLVY